MLRIFACNKYVSKVDKTVKEECSLCPNQLDDLCHYFYNCAMSSNVWQNIRNFITEKLNVPNANEIITMKTVMLGICSNVEQKTSLNFIILYVKNLYLD